MEALREERRPGSTTVPPELLARHAAEIENLTLELATLQVRGLCAGSAPAFSELRRRTTICCHLLLQEDVDSYRTTAEAVAEEKDAELARALEGNATLREQLAQAQARAAQVAVPPSPRDVMSQKGFNRSEGTAAGHVHEAAHWSQWRRLRRKTGKTPHLKPRRGTGRRPRPT